MPESEKTSSGNNADRQNYTRGAQQTDMMRVGLFGYYRFGNFGDDLMACLLAKHLAEQGTKVAILGLPRDLADLVGAETTQTSEELAKWADALILGGGAWLSDFNAPHATDNQKTVEADLFALTAAAEKCSIPCFAISIGGNSKGISRGVRTGVISYLTNRTFFGATVRLRSDVRFLENLWRAATSESRVAVYSPDIVFTSKEKLGVCCSSRKVERPKKQTVLIDLAQSKYERWLVAALYSVAKIDRSVEYAFVHNSIAERDRFIGWYSYTRNMPHIAYDNPIELLQCLSDASLVIGNRLHMGIAAMAMNVPFLSYSPATKASMALEELQWDSLIMKAGRRALPLTLSYIISLSHSQEQLAGLLPRNLAEVKVESFGHFEKMDEWLFQI